MRLPVGNNDLARSADAAVNAEIEQIFTNARHFESALPKLRRWANRRGWKLIFHRGFCAAQRIDATESHTFDTFGELLEWLFDQEQNHD